jgi:hypothetical protein
LAKALAIIVASPVLKPLAIVKAARHFLKPLAAIKAARRC